MTSVGWQKLSLRLSSWRQRYVRFSPMVDSTWWFQVIFRSLRKAGFRNVFEVLLESCMVLVAFHSADSLLCIRLFAPIFQILYIFFLWSTSISHLQQTNVFFWSNNLFLGSVVALKPVAFSLAHEANHGLCWHSPAHSWEFISVELQPSNR